MCVKRVVKIQQSTGSKSAVREAISRIKDIVSRGGYVNGLPRMYVRSLGGHFWESLKAGEQLTYLNNQVKVVSDDEKDPHIGDDVFQNKIIGGVAIYQTMLTKFMSSNYLQQKIFEFPNKLNGMINTSKGNYNYGLLLDNTATYLCVPNDEDSRIRRYEDLGYIIDVNPDIDEEEAAEDEVEE